MFCPSCSSARNRITTRWVSKHDKKILPPLFSHSSWTIECCFFLNLNILISLIYFGHSILCLLKRPGWKKNKNKSNALQNSHIWHFRKLHQPDKSRNVSATAVWHQIFSSALMCLPACYTIYTSGGYVGESGSVGWGGTGFGKSNDISPRLSVLILHHRVGVGAGWLHAPHPLMAAHKVTFISPARIFSEAPSRRQLFLPETPFFPPFLAVSSTYYF